VPLFDGRMFPQMLIAFAVIALLGLVLRRTFARDRRADPPWPPTDNATLTGSGTDTATLTDSARPDSDDFGLLAPVAVVDTAEEAQRVQSRLAEAGIKATSSVGTGGRHRVLVFETELNRARRVGGWSG